MTTTYGPFSFDSEVTGPEPYMARRGVALLDAILAGEVEHSEGGYLDDPFGEVAVLGRLYDDWEDWRANLDPKSGA